MTKPQQPVFEAPDKPQGGPPPGVAVGGNGRPNPTVAMKSGIEGREKEFGETKLPYNGTVRETANLELHEIRHLSVGRQALEFETEDQDGVRFKLSDYRGRVVLLYFWSEY